MGTTSRIRIAAFMVFAFASMCLPARASAGPGDENCQQTSEDGGGCGVNGAAGGCSVDCNPGSTGCCNYNQGTNATCVCLRAT